MGIILAILLFSAIIIFHELGHFTLAKLNGIRVDEFSLGLGPTIFGKQIGETKFSLKLLPFGGACMMGEDDSDDMSEGSFNSKGPWQRISVIAAGPIFNFIMALILSTIIVGWIGYDAPVIDQVDAGYSAQEEGLQAGDIVYKLDGKRIHLWKEITLVNMLNNDSNPVEMVYLRDGEKHTVTLTPMQLEDDAFPRMGFRSSGQYEEAGFFKSIQYGVYTLKYWINYTFECLKMLVTGQVGFDQLAGPVGIVNAVDDIYKETATAGFAVVLINLLNLSVLISANLGVMNLLPIPALDGGRLVFLVIELIRGKRVPPEKEGMVHMIGMVLLLALMVFVMYNDIVRLF